MTEQIFSAESGRINHVENGSGVRPVVVLHGVTLDWPSMAEISAALGPVAHTYACDLPCHGKSEWRDHRYRISDYDDLVSFVADVSGSGSVLIGFSLAALVALALPLVCLTWWPAWSPLSHLSSHVILISRPCATPTRMGG
jgi:pimeloyl-ACP methyl ester carboxylesterase